MRKKGEKPKPYKWTITKHGIIEHFDFNLWKIPDPPPINHETPIIPLHGFYHKSCWVMP